MENNGDVTRNKAQVTTEAAAATTYPHKRRKTAFFSTNPFADSPEKDAAPQESSSLVRPKRRLRPRRRQCACERPLQHPGDGQKEQAEATGSGGVADAAGGVPSSCTPSTCAQPCSSMPPPPAANANRRIALAAIGTICNTARRIDLDKSGFISTV